MYVVDITRVDKGVIESDMLVGKFSMDIKNKTMDYVCEYALANLNMSINKETLDYNMNLDYFSLRKFLYKNDNIDVDNDLIIQSIIVDKDNCIFVKKYSLDDTYPVIYVLNKNEIDNAKKLMTYLINDSLINKLASDNKLHEYDNIKKDYNESNIYDYNFGNEKIEIISLYQKGRFLDELLNNNLSFKQLNVSHEIKI